MCTYVMFSKSCKLTTKQVGHKIAVGSASGLWNPNFNQSKTILLQVGFAFAAHLQQAKQRKLNYHFTLQLYQIP